jgi:small ligand-binding sensory domain FIST
MKCASALSTDRDTQAAVSGVVGRVAEALGGERADIALAFASADHASGLGRVAREVRSAGLARHVLGCTGESIVGGGREVEEGPALSLWAVQLPDVSVRARRIEYDGNDFPGWEQAAGPSSTVENQPTLILLADPFTFPSDLFFKRLVEDAPGVRVVGGMASASQVPRGNRLVLDDEVFDGGAVAVELGGPVRLRTVVSQGCRPIGRALVVTKVEGNVIRELGRRPALDVLREVFAGLSPADQALVQDGLHIGRVINEYQESFHRGDFLVRNVLGADDAGGLAITDVVRVGQTVQFHVRDAGTADEDLRTLLESERNARPGSAVKGALLFTCNGRGTRLFPAPDHDVGVIGSVLGDVPVAGFFAMGELGPVGGQNFVHGFTASIALFEGPSGG